MQHPVTWQPSADGMRLIGHMILKKSVDGTGQRDSSAILGKVTDPMQKGGKQRCHYGRPSDIFTLQGRGMNSQGHIVSECSEK